MSIGDHSKLLGVVAIVCIAPVPYVQPVKLYKGKILLFVVMLATRCSCFTAECFMNKTF